METSEQTTIERLESHSIRWQARFYIERLFFTQRGRFALVLGMLATIYERVGAIFHEGVPSASRSTMPPTGAGATLLQVGEGALAVATMVLAGIVVLLFIDLYEDEVGTLSEVGDGDE